MKSTLTRACAAAWVFCACALPALAVPIADLRAVGAYPDLHDITVAPGTVVRLVYTLSDATDLYIFQNLITITGSVSGVSFTGSGTWWGGLASVGGNYQPASGMWIVLGEVPGGPPYSYSSPDPPDDPEVSLAFLDFTALAGPITVDLLSLGNPDHSNIWISADPQNFVPTASMEVDLDNSLPLVTIRTGSSQEIPEPASMLLLGFGLAATLLRRRRRV